MTDLVTLITPTGARPETFSLCESFIKKQTYKGKLQWIVVDDGPTPTTCTLNQEYYTAPKKWKEGYNTQRLNMDFAMSKVKGDILLVIEDDDWYSPHYISTMVNLLKTSPIVGEGNAKYYLLPVPGYKEMQNYQHASLCQTGLRSDAFHLLDKAINSGELYFDIKLWSLAKEASMPTLLFTNSNLAVGMKGLPGRKGIGIGHKQRDYIYDMGFTKLRSWIGSDVELYKKFTKPGVNNEKKVASGIQKSSKENSQGREVRRETSGGNPSVPNKKSLFSSQA